MSVPPAPAIETPCLDALGHASESDLLDALQSWNDCVRRAQAVVAGLASEIARRSTPDLGYDGLAQRAGARTPENLVSQLTGTSVREARDLVAVGRVMDAAPPWLGDVGAGVSDGSLSIGVAAAITTGLGTPTADVAADDLLDAARRLVTEAPGLSPEQVARRAREARDELDAAGAQPREEALRAKRSLRWRRDADGMTHFHAVLDPESSAFVIPAIETVLAPRNGGPRFVDDAERARAKAVVDDPRTTEQLALDTLVELLRIAVSADPGRVYGQRKPLVRVHVAERDLAARTGSASVEGCDAPVSARSAERIACADGYTPIVVRPGGRLDVGLTKRLFTSRQREALAAYWGGCAIPGCDRPPSWCEAHHGIAWSLHGPTDLANGILLCRHHHMLMHNNGWRTDPPRSPGGRWWLHAPPGHTRHGQPVELVPKNPVMRRMLTAVRT